MTIYLFLLLLVVCYLLVFFWASIMAQLVTNLPETSGDRRDSGSIPGSGWPPGEGNGNTLQYPFLENPTDRGALGGYRPWDCSVRHGWVQTQARKLVAGMTSRLASNGLNIIEDYSESFGCHFPGGVGIKESAYNAGDPCSIPGLGRSPGEGNGNTFQYSCLENLMDRGAWQAIVCGVTELNRTEHTDSAGE